jgi:hypothetical protein
MGMASVFKIPNADIPPVLHHIFQQMADAYTGKIDNGRIS